MIDKVLSNAGFPVVVTNRWKRRRTLLDPESVTSIRQKVSDQLVISESSVGAWVQESGKVWLLNPTADPFVIVVEAPPRGRAAPSAEHAVQVLAAAIVEASGAKLDGRAAIPLVEKPPVVYAAPERMEVLDEEVVEE